MTIEEMFEEYAGRLISIEECKCNNIMKPNCSKCISNDKRLKIIIKTITKQIQSDLLKEILKLQREDCFDGSLNGRMIFLVESEDIKKLAEEKEINFSTNSGAGGTQEKYLKF